MDTLKFFKQYYLLLEYEVWLHKLPVSIKFAI